jgi:ethanolamine ammonia-lyase large subunit
MRDLLGLKPAPEFADWLERMGLMTDRGLIEPGALPPHFRRLIA